MFALVCMSDAAVGLVGGLGLALLKRRIEGLSR